MRRMRSYSTPESVDVHTVTSLPQASSPPPRAMFNYVMVALNGARSSLHTLARQTARNQFTGIDLGPLPEGPGPPLASNSSTPVP